MAQNYYDVDEAAKILGVSRADINQMVLRRELYGYRDGADWKFKPEDIERVANPALGVTPNGTENEDTGIAKPFNPTLINIETKQMGLDTLIARMKHDEINLLADFQGAEVWKPTARRTACRVLADTNSTSRLLHGRNRRERVVGSGRPSEAVHSEGFRLEGNHEVAEPGISDRVPRIWLQRFAQKLPAAHPGDASRST